MQLASPHKSAQRVNAVAMANDQRVHPDDLDATPQSDPGTHRPHPKPLAPELTIDVIHPGDNKHEITTRGHG